MSSPSPAHPLASIEELLSELRAARPIIVVDDDDRENEGDLILPGETVTEQQMAFTIRHTGGVVCLAMSNELADRLELPPMVQCNTSPLQTAYTVSIEAAHGVSTGISARDRVTTIRATVRPGASARDLRRPGHVFPLRARDGGVLERRGHTEAAVDLCRLAGLAPVGAISELMHDDGSLMRLPDLMRFATVHGLKIGSIADLVAYRLSRDPFMRRVTRARLPTRYGEFDVHGFEDARHGDEHVVLTTGNIDDGRPVLVRVHSECLTGDGFGSLRCDCGPQRDASLSLISREGRGAFVHLRQEGRGIGLLNKLRAYALQDQGADTVEANEKLGFAPDLRDYSMAAQMLHMLGVTRVLLLTNNPAKVRALEEHGIHVIERIPLRAGESPHNREYLATKARKLGHLLP